MRVSPGARPTRWLPLAVVAVVLAAGCGGSTGTVTGSVSYKGTKLKGGLVVFVAPNGTGTTSGEIQEDGTYTLDGCPAGPVKVAVQTSYLKPPAGSAGAIKYERPKEAQGNTDYKPPDQSKNKERYMAIPQKYEDPSASGLTYTVTGGKQTHDISLD